MLCYIIILLGECSVPLLEGVVAKITLQAVGNGVRPLLTVWP